MKKIILTAIALTGSLFMSMYMSTQLFTLISGLQSFLAQFEQYAGMDLTQVYGADIYTQLTQSYIDFGINIALFGGTAILAIFIFALITMLSRYGNKILGALFVAVALECIGIGSIILLWNFNSITQTFISSWILQIILTVIPLVIVLLCVIGLLATKGGKKKTALINADASDEVSASGHAQYKMVGGRRVKRYVK